jgi:phosphate transport system permease protein
MAAVDPTPTNPFAASGNLPRRQRVDRAARSSAQGAAAFAVALLVLVVASVFVKGVSQLSINFLVKDPVQTLNGTGGGIANAIVGSAVVVAFGTALAVPFGVLIAIFLTEFATPRTARPIRLALDLLNGLPSIVVAVFIFGLVVEGTHQSGYAASIALAIIMVPLIARNTGEMLQLVSQDLRNASHALGISRWRTIFGIVLPSALGGIVTGVVLSVARAAGETAPMLLLNSIVPNATVVNIFGGPVGNIPYLILSDSESSLSSDHARAWGAAFILIAVILVCNLGARGMLERQRRKIMAR